MSLSSVDEIAAGAGVLLVSGVAWLSIARAGLIRRRAEAREHRRARQAHSAAVEASLDEELFAPEHVTAAVDEIVSLASDVLHGVGRPALTRRDAPVIERWANATVERWGDGLHVVGQPSVDFLRVVNRADENEDRIVLRVGLRLRRSHVRFGESRSVKLDERWTLGRTAGEWVLLSVDADPLAVQVLTGSLVPAAWDDRTRLQEQSLAELADLDSAGVDTDLGSLVSPDRPAAEQLLELAALDGRFDRQLLDLSVGHLVEAWEQASSGSEQLLTALASPLAVGLLLHPPAGDRTDTLVLRDAALVRWRPARLDLAGRAPRLHISLIVSAVRYIVTTASGAHVTGSIEIRHDMQLEWTLEQTGSGAAPWQLIDTTNPATELPGLD